MKNPVFPLAAAAIGLLIPAAAAPAPAASGRQAVEVGAVEWERDFEGALEKSRGDGRPVLVLFQEVPGCSGCREFGREVLTHPVIVASAEREFIPVLVYNNRPGRDAEILDRYSEPAWNYQVIRFLDGDGEDFIPRRDRVWTVQGVARRMVEALEAAGRDVPADLGELAEKDLPET